MTYYISLNPIDFTVNSFSRKKKDLSGYASRDYVGEYVDSRYVELFYNNVWRIAQGDTEFNQRLVSVIVTDKVISFNDLKTMQKYPHLPKIIVEKLMAEMKEKFAKALEEEKKYRQNTPYLTEIVATVVKNYNKDYGDDRTCICGHPYYRHFDTYPDSEGVRMRAIGCKYCECREFVEFQSK